VKKIGLLALALVLALGSLGVAYAMWYEDLFIEGTVDTGELDADLILTGYWEEGDDKDVSSIDAYVCGKTLYVTVNNAYPDVWYWVTFDIYNSGTIPLHACGFDVDEFSVGPGVQIYYCGPDLIQIHPGESTSNLCIAIYLINDAAQSATNTFTFDYVNVQYNEAFPTVDIPFS
jgi:hypothetical protein